MNQRELKTTLEVRQVGDTRQLHGLALPLNTLSNAPVESNGVTAFEMLSQDCIIRFNSDIEATVNHEDDKLVASTRLGNLDVSSKPSGIHFVLDLLPTIKTDLLKGRLSGVSTEFTIDDEEQAMSDEGEMVRVIKSLTLYRINPLTSSKSPAYGDASSLSKRSAAPNLVDLTTLTRRELSALKAESKSEQGKALIDQQIQKRNQSNTTKTENMNTDKGQLALRSIADKLVTEKRAALTAGGNPHVIFNAIAQTMEALQAPNALLAMTAKKMQSGVSEATFSSIGSFGAVAAKGEVDSADDGTPTLSALNLNSCNYNFDIESSRTAYNGSPAQAAAQAVQDGYIHAMNSLERDLFAKSAATDGPTPIYTTAQKVDATSTPTTIKEVMEWKAMSASAGVKAPCFIVSSTLYNQLDGVVVGGGELTLLDKIEKRSKVYISDNLPSTSDMIITDESRVCVLQSELTVQVNPYSNASENKVVFNEFAGLNAGILNNDLATVYVENVNFA